MKTTTKIMCPNCFKTMLETENDKDLDCPLCGTKFIKVNEKTVKFK